MKSTSAAVMLMSLGLAITVFGQFGHLLSDHFAAWEAQGWSLGNLTSAYINVETGGGVGSIEFPVADVMTTN